MNTGNAPAKMFDAIVLGGGPAGSAAAQTLARAGLRAALIHRGQARPFPVGEGLPPAARPLLHTLGITDRLAAGPHRPSWGNLSAWGSGILEATDFIRDPNGHGWHLDRSAFDGLLRGAAADAGAVVYSVVSPPAVCRTDAGTWCVLITVDTGPLKISTPWLLDCTGRRSRLAREQGARRVRYDRLVAHVALFQSEHTGDLDATTLVEAVPEGWWYTVRLPSGERIAAYLTDADMPTGRQAQSAAKFAELLRQTRHVCERLQPGSYRLMGGPWVAAAQTTRLTPCAGPGWLAAGDAALALDPISSQGLFHALASGIGAGRAVADLLAGDTRAVAEYERSQDAVFTAYLAHWADVYAQERRWPDSPFWQRRHRRMEERRFP